MFFSDINITLYLFLRHACYVAYSECVAEDHVARCDCKEGFHGNGTKACFPEGFEEEDNGNSYKMVYGMYVTFQNASDTCAELGARLPVLDTIETIKIIQIGAVEWPEEIELSESAPLGPKRGWSRSYPVVQWSLER